MRLLIAEDDRALSGFLRRGLCSAGDEVAIAHDGETALKLFAEREPDLLLLDLQLPRRSGQEVLAAVRERSPLCSVLVLSGIALPETRITCLELGADDCMLKPFMLGELRARCGAILRRREAARALVFEAEKAVRRADAEAMQMGALKLDRTRRRAEVAGSPLHLTPREFELLEQLLLARGGTVPRESLRERVWEGSPAAANVVDVHIAALRRKLSKLPGSPFVGTVRGQGYRLRSDDVSKG